MTAAKILGPKGLEILERRGISAETAVRFGIYTVSRRGEGGETLPDVNGNILAFPFLEHGAVVAEKYRTPDKQFWQRKGGRRTFWNSDALDDPALETGHMPLIITEGEPDALVAIDCGFPLTVSVPDGAPPVPDGEDPEALKDIDPDNEHTGKFEFLWNNRDRLKRIKRFIVAVDNDPQGRRLAAELVRRLSPSRCLFVTYPDNCKDLNDVLITDGTEGVAAVLNGARPYPVRGLYRLADYPELPPIPTFSTGWEMVDRHLKVFAGEFMVVTGIPSHGKSTWVINLLVNLHERYRWRSALFSPEMPTVPHLRDKLRKMILRRPALALDTVSVAEADRRINDAFVFIDSDPSGGGDDDDFDLDWILDRATDAVLRDGVRVLLIDPWNEIEHAKRKDESMTEYIGRSIRSLKRFAREYQVAVIVIAHPTKDVGKDGRARAPTLYDIDGSAHWCNKPDHGVVVYRDGEEDEASIRIAKVRFEDTGEKGLVRMAFDRHTSRFYHLDRSDASDG